MDWIERLNGTAARVALGDGLTAGVLHWAYQKHLRDNVPHRHTYFEVCLVGVHGAGEFRVEGKAHPLTPGTLFIARPGVVHQIVNTAEPLMELYWVSFQWEPGKGEAVTGELRVLRDGFTESADRLAVADIGGSLGGIWRSLRTVAELPGAGGDAQISCLASALLLGIARAGGRSNETTDPESTFDADQSLARIAVRYIHDNLNRPLSVAEVAAYLHLSPRHLTRLVTRFTGVAPAAYMEKARIDRARGLLLRTDDPIKQIASQVGYADIHHFTRAFARVVGCPPGKFRRIGGVGRVLNHENEGALV